MDEKRITGSIRKRERITASAVAQRPRIRNAASVEFVGGVYVKKTYARGGTLHPTCWLPGTPFYVRVLAGIILYYKVGRD